MHLGGFVLNYFHYNLVDERPTRKLILIELIIPPTLIGAGNQITIPTSTGNIQGLSLAKPTLKVPMVGMSRLLNDSHQYAWACYEGQFTPWTTKSDHGRWRVSMVWFDGPTSMVRFLEIPIYKAFGPLTMCKQNVGQEEWPCTRKWTCWFFLNMPQQGNFGKKRRIKFDHSLIFTCLHLLFHLKHFIKNFIITSFLCHGPLPFSYHSTYFAPPTTKPVRPCQWIT